MEEKEKRKVQINAPTYYLRKEIQEAIFEFCKNRETVPNFNQEFFGKRPDSLDYPSDIMSLVKKGATSFHCSEELWEDPLEIKTEMSAEEYNEIKIGWDFLIDIDSKFLDYSKIAARLLIGELEKHGIKNYGIKFSGSKGFHILVPFKAFPEKIDETFTKDMFPEWPRTIANYLFKSIREPMNEEILKLSGRDKLEKSGELISEHLCPKCDKSTIEKKVGKYICQDTIKCKSELESMKSNRKEMVCPSCFGKMDRISERTIYFCENCKINTAQLEASASNYGGQLRKKENDFKVEDTIKSTEDAVDIVLVASRHLFRAPYSLHEKTSFSSIVINKEQIEDFKPSDADILKINKPKSFLPNSEPGEAKELLIQALEWGKTQEQPKKSKQWEGKAIDLKGLTITENMFPEVIKKLMKGQKQDGRKRALSVLLAFFSALEFPQDYIEEKIEKWNKKNYKKLKEGYIKSQIDWAIKNKRLPPNYDKPTYKELGVLSETQGVKNPINYTVREAMRKKGKNKSTNQQS